MTPTHNAHDNDFHELRGEPGLHKIADLLQGMHIAMINTVAADGSINSRPMAVQQKTFDGQLWFLTRVSSEKVDEIQQDQHVTLTLTDKSAAKYLTLKGRATVSQDRAKIAELWNDMYKAWFPDGQTDPEIAVLRVDITEAEYWQASSSSLIRGVKYLAAAVTGGKTPSAKPATFSSNAKSAQPHQSPLPPVAEQTQTPHRVSPHSREFR